MKKRMKKDTSMTFKTDKEFVKKVSAYAEKNGTTVSALIRDTLNAVIAHPMVVVDRGRVIVATEVQIKNVETLKH